VGEWVDDQECVRNAVAQIASNAAVWAGIERAITAIQCVPDYLNGKLLATSDVGLASSLRELIRQTQEAIGLLHDDKQSGYQLFFRYSFVAHWAYFEAFLDDFVAARLAVVPGLQDRLNERLQISKATPWTGNSLTSRLGEKGYKKKDNFGVFVQQLLKSVEVPDVELDERQIAVLNFSNAARNCFLHNGGVWDAKACEPASMDIALIGAPIVISRQHFLDCYDVVKDILVMC
jgi:hypothetical protein